MNGLTLSSMYYETCGRPLIEAEFPDFVGRIVCGLVGEGSDCFGFDDEWSTDHDWGTGFCLWLTDEDAAAIGKPLQALYDRLPQTFHGYAKKTTGELAGQRIGVLRISDFYTRYTGYPEGPRDLADWLRVPEHFLATATNGRVFTDPLGAFSSIRDRLLDFYPEDVRLKLIASRLATMAQAGQYNYPRLVRRNERVAAHLALSEFIRATGSLVYLLNRKYAPF